jgi:hypothetical protein
VQIGIVFVFNNFRDTRIVSPVTSTAVFEWIYLAFEKIMKIKLTQHLYKIRGFLGISTIDTLLQHGGLIAEKGKVVPVLN